MTEQDMHEEREQRLAEESLVLLVQSIIHRELRKKGLKYRHLARRLRVSEARISQLLGDDPPNLTVRTVAKILYQLGEVGVFMTERELEEQITGTVVAEPSTWVFTVPAHHFYGGEDDSEIIFEMTTAKEAADDSRAWIAAEAAASGRMRRI